MTGSVRLAAILLYCARHADAKEASEMSQPPLRLLTDDDLDYLFVNIEPDNDDSYRETITVRQMTDRQFRRWIVGMGDLHGIQMLPSLGRIGMDTRLAMVNRLIRHGVRIYLTPRDWNQPGAGWSGTRD
jgi:hypothetical protein